MIRRKILATDTSASGPEFARDERERTSRSRPSSFKGNPARAFSSPISEASVARRFSSRRSSTSIRSISSRSEEHTSELQSRQYLVCRLLLEKKKKKNT